MATVKFTSTKLEAMGKKGVLTPDIDGYYEIIVGGLNTFNSAGEYYTLEGAKQLFQESSTFMRMINDGSLMSEFSHPKMLPGMTMDQYVRRILTIDEQNVCGHFKEIRLDEDFGKNNPQHGDPKLVAIIGKFKPCGPKGQYVKEYLDTPGQNVSFSIRAMTKDYYQGGITHRVLTSIVTWDYVSYRGIDVACSRNAPSLEELDTHTVSVKQLLKLSEQVSTPVSLESDTRIKECIKNYKEIEQLVTLPVIRNW